MVSGADAGLRMTVRKKNKTDMQEMKRHVSVRPARKSDAADIARLVVMAWPVEAFLAHGNGQTVDDLIDLVADMAAREDTLYSYRNTVVAELAPGGAGADSTIREGLPEETDAAGAGQTGPVVGIMIGYDGARLRSLRRPVEEAFAARFGVSDMKWDDETGEGEFYYDSVAVDPAYRGYGIGSALFDAMDRRAAQFGHDVVGLLVDLDNPSAEKLYERLGFRTVGEKDFFGHRMKHKQKNVLR